VVAQFVQLLTGERIDCEDDVGRAEQGIVRADAGTGSLIVLIAVASVLAGAGLYVNGSACGGQFLAISGTSATLCSPARTSAGTLITIDILCDSLFLLFRQRTDYHRRRPSAPVLYGYLPLIINKIA